MAEPHALVLERVEGAPLAQKPNLQVLLRCRWAAELQFRAAWIAGVAHGVASSLAYLHEHHICHGPLLLSHTAQRCDSYGVCENIPAMPPCRILSCFCMENRHLGVLLQHLTGAPAR